MYNDNRWSLKELLWGPSVVGQQPSLFVKPVDFDVVNMVEFLTISPRGPGSPSRPSSPGSPGSPTLPCQSTRTSRYWLTPTCLLCTSIRLQLRANRTANKISVFSQTQNQSINSYYKVYNSNAIYSVFLHLYGQKYFSNNLLNERQASLYELINDFWTLLFEQSVCF